MRLFPSSGLFIGSYAVGAWGSPASIAHSARLSSDGFLPKYVCAASFIPYVPCPK